MISPLMNSEARRGAPSPTIVAPCMRYIFDPIFNRTGATGRKGSLHPTAKKKTPRRFSQNVFGTKGIRAAGHCQRMPPLTPQTRAPAR